MRLLNKGNRSPAQDTITRTSQTGPPQQSKEILWKGQIKPAPTKPAETGEITYTPLPKPRRKYSKDPNNPRRPTNTGTFDPKLAQQIDPHPTQQTVPKRVQQTKPKRKYNKDSNNKRWQKKNRRVSCMEETHPHTLDIRRTIYLSCENYLSFFYQFYYQMKNIIIQLSLRMCCAEEALTRLSPGGRGSPQASPLRMRTWQGFRMSSTALNPRPTCKLFFFHLTLYTFLYKISNLFLFFWLGGMLCPAVGA